MNLQYIKYALEISRTGSISKAAENLSVAQPNLSRAVKELESQLGISIFERTRTGMAVTPEGERLLTAGERILRDVGELETMFSGEAEPRRSLSVTAAPAAYLSHAWVSFCASLPDSGRFDVSYREASLSETLDGVCDGTCKLGIIRIPLHFERYYTEKLARRELRYETVAEFTPVILAGLGSPLAGKESATESDLAELCELRSPDSLDRDANGEGNHRKEIAVTDRATVYALLSADLTAYLCAAPMPPASAARYGLIQRPLAAGPLYRDLLVVQKSYRFTDTDEAFLRALKGSARGMSDRAE
jgi:DNA-binding transcriptional LysR family regulator